MTAPNRRDVLKGLALAAGVAAVPFSGAATVRMRQWFPVVSHAQDVTRWLETVPIMQRDQWHYQQLAEGTGIIRHMPTRMAFWTLPERGSWWRKSAYRLIAEGTPLMDPPDQGPRRLHVARAAAHIASRVGFMREEGESVLAWYGGRYDVWPWTGALDTHTVETEPAAPLVAMAGNPCVGDLWLYI